jgi:dinuclear metal center YbgI/SA1388 family protein
MNQDTINLTTLCEYGDELLAVTRFKDYCPNGLQVEGHAQVKKIVSGVTACQALIDAAVAANADVLLVHHGYFWKGEDPCLTGIKKKRLKALLDADISLLAYHLPLDAHPDYGNNIELAKRLDFRNARVLEDDSLVWRGEFVDPLTPTAVTARIEQELQRAPLHIDGGNGLIHSIAWCSGGAQDFIESVAQAGIDAFISGEISERTVHIAREYGIHYFAAGHHATERYGVQALGAHLAEQFGIAHEFIEIENPV